MSLFTKSSFFSRTRGLAAMAGLLTIGVLMAGCQHTKHSVKKDVDPFRYDGMRGVKEGNLQLIVSSIDYQTPQPFVLVEIERKSDGDEMDTTPRRIFYNRLPDPSANMLVLSHYDLEPGSYRITFWERGTGTAAKTDIHLSDRKHYLVAFYEQEETGDGNTEPKFKVLHSNTPIVTDLTPRQIGKVK